MKLGTALVDGAERVVALDAGTGQLRLVLDADGAAPADMIHLITGGGDGRPLALGDPIGSPGQVVLKAPIPRPRRNIMCVGKNYRAHAAEFTASGFDSSAASAAEAVPEHPIIFTKAPETVIADGDPVPYPSGVSEAVDYEAELAVVIGRGGRGIRRADAYGHVWGYTIVNDVTARDLQGRHKQWFLGKSLDGFCPMGPWIVTADEIDPEALEVTCRVNGELRQQARTSDLIFDIPCLIETISAGLTLMPGDIIATGTPAGVGIGFKPPRYLAPGDEVRIEISGIGTLTNRLA